MIAAILAANLIVAVGYPNANLLIEAPDLAVAGKTWVVLDVRGKNLFDAGHIPGSQWIDTKDWAKAFQNPDVGSWSKKLAAIGVGPKSKVAVIGGDDVRETARAWYILHYFNLAEVRLVNGGWSAWLAAKGNVTKESTTVGAMELQQLQPRPELLATKDQLLADLKTSSPQIVDSRSKGEYCGEADTAKRNGMIPGAIHLEWSECIDPVSKKFKSADELEKLITERKINRNAPVVTYCQSGGRAAVVAFSLELMGGKQVKNYYRSWSEWGNADDTPVVKPDAKK